MTTHGPDSSVETIGGGRPGHQDESDPPNPWEEAASEIIQTVSAMHSGISSEIGLLPTPGATTGADLADLERAKEHLASAFAAFRFARRMRAVRSHLERQARKA